MDNVYLRGEELKWSEFFKCYIKFYSIPILLAILIIIMSEFGMVKNSADYVYNAIYFTLLMPVFIQLMKPRFNKCFFDDIRFKSEGLFVIIIPIIIAGATRILVDMLQLLPTIFGGEIIGIGEEQLDRSLFNTLESIVAATLVGPFLEEIIFRTVFFTSIAYIVGYIDNKFKREFSGKIFNLKMGFCWILIIVDNILFSFIHLPDISNFHLYFISGVINTIVYIKYGFYGSWLSHGAFNFFKFNAIYSFIGII